MRLTASGTPAISYMDRPPVLSELIDDILNCRSRAHCSALRLMVPRQLQAPHRQAIFLSSGKNC